MKTIYKYLDCGIPENAVTRVKCGLGKKTKGILKGVRPSDLSYVDRAGVPDDKVANRTLRYNLDVELLVLINLTFVYIGIR